MVIFTIIIVIIYIKLYHHPHHVPVGKDHAQPGPRLRRYPPTAGLQWSQSLGCGNLQLLEHWGEQLDHTTPTTEQGVVNMGL